MILLWLALSLLPGDPERAERAYRERRFAEAYALYEQALATNEYSAGALQFNLGNCAYHLEQPALAILHYRRAERTLPDDPDLQSNRRQAEAQLGLPPQPALREDPDRRRALSLLAAALQTVGLCGAVLLTRRGARVVLLLLAGVGAAAGIAALQPPAAAPEAGVVLAATLDVHAAPAADGEPVGRLTAGELVFVTGQQDGRIQVRHARATGWVARDGLALID